MSVTDARETWDATRPRNVEDVHFTGVTSGPYGDLV
jgi:hypothetical protein